MTLGQKLKSLRKDANLSQRALAAKVEIDFTYLSKIENDKTDNRPPSANLLKRLSVALRADEDELLMLAGRLPDDARKALVHNKKLLHFFRSVKDRADDDAIWDKMNALLSDKEKLRK